MLNRSLKVNEGFRDIFWSLREGFGDILGSGRGQRHLWANEGFRNIFGAVRVSEVSLDQGGVQRSLPGLVKGGFRTSEMVFQYTRDTRYLSARGRLVMCV